MHSKLRLVLAFCLLFLVFSVKAQQTYWRAAVNELDKTLSAPTKKDPSTFFELDLEAFKAAVLNAQTAQSLVYFPNAAGQIEAYSIAAQPTLSNELAGSFPAIQSYKGIALRDPKRHVFFALSPKGLSLTAMSEPKGGNSGVYFIEKETQGSTYILYKAADKTQAKNFICETLPDEFTHNVNAAEPALSNKNKASAGGQTKKTTVKTYRLAVAATGEYTQYHGGTIEGVLSAINATITRVNALFGKDLGLQLQLIEQTTNVIYTDAETDPFGSDLNSEIQETLTANIGAANYDIGHLFHKDTNGGNAGFVGALCQDSKKGSAFSSAQFPEGDTYDIDFVAHEMGHQLGAYHTWSYESEGTGVQVEPGSGSTIMSYAGIVSGENVAANASDYFHAVSILQINEYLDDFACETSQLTNNDAPVIAPLESFGLPMATPFVLSAQVTDSDSQGLSYAWEQGDSGVVTAAIFGPENPVGASFRSLEPAETSERYFPKLANVAANIITTNAPQSSQWETLSSVPRDYTFYLTVRDNELSGAGIDMAKTTMKVLPKVGPFVIHSLGAEANFQGGQPLPLSWEVARTNGPELNTQRLSAFLSVDGGLSFDQKIAGGILNDGLVTLRLPNVNTANARLMLKAENNPFFAVNATDFSINATAMALFYTQTDLGLCAGAGLELAAQIVYASEVLNPDISFSGLPLGLTVSATTGTLSGTQQALSIDFTAAATVAAGTYSVVAHLNSGSESFSSSLSLSVWGGVLETPALITPLDSAVNLFTDQTFEWSAVAGALAYELQIATDVNFNSLTYSSTTPFNKVYVTNLQDGASYFWRVKPLNECALGDFSEVASFATAAVNCLTKTAAALPITIGANDPNTINSYIDFDEEVPLSSLTLGLDITHSYLSDLVVKLYAPSGKSAVILAYSCSASEDVNATFSQEAEAFECSNKPAISGLVKPLGSFEVFRGESIKGRWRLEIQDVAEIDGGSLNAFSMTVCVAGEFRPDADQDGVYDDGPDQCLNTPLGVTVDTKGCAVYRLSDRNFTLSLKSQSCINNTDGSIEIAAVSSMNYTIDIKNAQGNSVRQSNFTRTYTAEGLAAGSYLLCVTGATAAVTYETQCYEVLIGAPEPLSVLSSVAFSNGQLHLELQGSDSYFVNFNGATSSALTAALSLKLKAGINTLKVSTGLDCQGVYEESFYYTPKPSIYPNPVQTQLFLQTPVFKNATMKVQLHRLSGALIKEINTQASRSPLPIDMSGLEAGVYIISIQLDGLRTQYKVLKE